MSKDSVQSTDLITLRTEIEVIKTQISKHKTELSILHQELKVKEQLYKQKCKHVFVDRKRLHLSCIFCEAWGPIDTYSTREKGPNTPDIAEG